MRTRSLHTLIVALAALAAVFMVVSPDDLREYESAYVRQEVLRESAESIATHRDPHVVVGSTQFGSSSQHRRAPRAAAMTASLALVCLSTCVLLC